MKYLLLLLLPFLANCGLHVSSDPVIVKHEISIDYDAIDKLCDDDCRGLQGDTAAFNSCKNTCYTQMVQAIINSTK